VTTTSAVIERTCADESDTCLRHSDCCSLRCDNGVCVRDEP
jgi:hypothetical protein